MQCAQTDFFVSKEKQVVPYNDSSSFSNPKLMHAIKETADCISNTFHGTLNFYLKRSKTIWFNIF